MSLLAPFFLWLGVAGAVPLLIHLLRRHVGMRIEFPAARYLARAEEEHRRTLRLRNLLLMVVRVLAVLLLTVAASRPVSSWLGSGHSPTALALVIDNSMSTGVVEEGRPLLDQIKAIAADVVSRATPGDRVWAVQSDGTVIGGTPAAVRSALARVEPLGGAGDLHAAVSRAAGLARASGLESRQVAVLTDGQRTSWPNEPAVDAQILIWTPAGPAPPNRAVTLAEARPTRWTPRGAVVARFQSVDSVAYHVTLAGQLLTRGIAAPGEEVTIHAAPQERGWLSGTVEIDPDELAADNVRYFAVWIGTAPAVSVHSGAGPFLETAVDVLRGSGEVGSGDDIEVESADELATLPAFITAPSDPVRIGVANRALERAGIPWRYGERHGSAPAAATGEGIDRVEVSSRYDLVPQAGAVADTLAAVGRDPWIVAGSRYVLVGSPLSPEATTLPVSARFIPWLASALRDRLGGASGGVISATPGERVSRPALADALETSNGIRTTLGDQLTAPSASGAYFLISGSRRVGALVVNPPPEESNLDRLTPSELATRIRGAQTRATSSTADFVKMAFGVASRRSLVDAFLFAGLAMLLIESLVVTARRRERTA